RQVGLGYRTHGRRFIGTVPFQLTRLSVVHIQSIRAGRGPLHADHDVHPTIAVHVTDGQRIGYGVWICDSDTLSAREAVVTDDVARTRGHRPYARDDLRAAVTVDIRDGDLRSPMA